MMDMLKAYAHQVVSYLPEKQRDDLYAEIYDGLCEEYEDWHMANPEMDETGFLNQNRQHPMKYATQLADDQSPWLIGPQFYFSFLSALKVTVSLVFLLHMVVGTISVLAGDNVWSSFWSAIMSVPQSMLWACASVLGVFVALEKGGERATWLDRWDARDLKPIQSHKPISRFETAFNLGFATLALLVILDVIDFPAVVRHDGEWIHEWVFNLPGWFWGLAGLMLMLDIVFAIYRLMRIHWSRNLRLLTIANNVVWLVLLVYAASRSPLLTNAQESAAEFLPLVEHATRGGLLVACAIIAWDTIQHTWQVLKNHTTLDPGT